jgi:prepilin-type N-terminal cleavage/methylation domain-containing protein
MRLPRIASRARAGFTLIELLVVIAIIAILVALLGSGIFYAYIRMQDTANQNDISQLQSSLQAFKGKFTVYPPSTLYLNSNSGSYNPKNPLHVNSLTFINQLWPNIGQFTQMDWSGTGNAIDETLQGDQVMVFCLGGIPWAVPPGGGGPVLTCNNGFSANGKNPCLPPTANVGRVKNFYDFPASRLYMRADPASGKTSNYFPSFMDAYSSSTGRLTPYVYFSSNNRKNGYNPYPNAANPNSQGFPMAIANTTGGGFALVIPYYSSPYANGAGLYQNPDTFQILGAGYDGNFNTAAVPNAFLWTATNTTNLTVAGQDDIANFTDSKMKVAQ